VEIGIIFTAWPEMMFCMKNPNGSFNDNDNEKLMIKAGNVSK
jgi:hypothetical protein